METYILISPKQYLINQLRFQNKHQDSKRHFKQVAPVSLRESDREEIQ